MTQVVPPPNPGENEAVLPGVGQYIDLLKKYYPKSRPSFVGLEGYVNARILVEGLKRAGQEITRESFIQAIESIHQYDLGILNPLSFGENDYQGLDRVYFTRITQGEPVLIQ